MGLALHRRNVQYIEDIDLEQVDNHFFTLYCFYSLSHYLPQEYNIICFKECEEQPDPHPDHQKCPHHEKDACVEHCKSECREGKKETNNLFTAMERAYDKGANNCFVAALLYLASVVQCISIIMIIGFPNPSSFLDTIVFRSGYTRRQRPPDVA